MAIGIFILPICDACHRPWLPDGWKPGDDPRTLAGGRTLRCGKCKSSGWDREYNAAQRKKESLAAVPQVSLDDVRATVCGLSENPSPALLEALSAPPRAATPPRRRCKHSLYSCPECHPQEAA